MEIASAAHASLGVRSGLHREAAAVEFRHSINNGGNQNEQMKSTKSLSSCRSGNIMRFSVDAGLKP